MNTVVGNHSFNPVGEDNQTQYTTHHYFSSKTVEKSSAIIIITLFFTACGYMYNQLETGVALGLGISLFPSAKTVLVRTVIWIRSTYVYDRYNSYMQQIDYRVPLLSLVRNSIDHIALSVSRIANSVLSISGGLFVFNLPQLGAIDISAFALHILSSECAQKFIEFTMSHLPFFRLTPFLVRVDQLFSATFGIRTMDQLQTIDWNFDIYYEPVPDKIINDNSNRVKLKDWSKLEILRAKVIAFIPYPLEFLSFMVAQSGGLALNTIIGLPIINQLHVTLYMNYIFIRIVPELIKMVNGFIKIADRFNEISERQNGRNIDDEIDIDYENTSAWWNRFFVVNIRNFALNYAYEKTPA